uniref:Pulmonary surfactant-associated protein B n=1 Tax=Naja naja TaxID=35670 RepID=A0A8C6VTJ1_NAJNA
PSPSLPFPVVTSKIQNECAKGAAYWCSNLMTAIQCGALDHCLGEVGGSQRVSPFFFQDMCADCKQILSILVRMAKESAFKKYLEDECTNLPLQTLIPQCQALVKDYYARLIDPSLICTQLGACPADLPGSQDGLMQLLRGLEWLLPQLQGQVSTLPSGHTQAPGELLLPIPLPLCWLCRTFIGKAESVIPKATIGKAMSKLCYVLPGVVAGMCQCLMEKYTVIIVDALVSKLGPRLICGMMLMCASEENCGPGTKALSLWKTSHAGESFEEGGPAAAVEAPSGKQGFFGGTATPSLPSHFSSTLCFSSAESLVQPAAAEGCRECLLISGQVVASLRANRTRRAVEAALSSACSLPFPPGLR